MSIPTKEQILQAVITGRCCFCDSRRVFLMIGQHWSRTDRISLDALRDDLVLPKGFGFLSNETQERFRERAKRNYPAVAERLHAAPKPPTRDLNSYGRAIQKNKALKAPHPAPIMVACPECGKPKRKARDQVTCGAEACKFALRSRVSTRPAPWAHPPRTEPKRRPCKICGTEIVGGRRKTCSPECWKAAVVEAAKARDKSVWRAGAAKWKR